MALTRKFLSALGIEAEKIDQIIEAHTEVTDTIKSELDGYRTNAEKLTEVQKKFDETEKKLTESEDFKKQLEELRSKISAKETAEKKSGELKQILMEKGYSEKGIEKIVKYGGYLDGIEFDGNGTVRDSDRLVTAIESEWSEYKPVETTTYAEPSRPPENNGISGTKSEIAQYAEAYYNRLYGAKKED